MLEKTEIRTQLCVIGGGLAGICAAVAAAREGCKVVLMHERPMLGGNASSEIRMWVCGAQGNNVAETGIMEELFTENLRLNPYKLHPVFDALLWQKVTAEDNITLLMNCSCFDAEMNGDRIVSVTGWQMTTQKLIRVRAELFADCSGDSILAPLTGAAFRFGREASGEFGENVGTVVPDRKTMGNSCLIQAHKGNVPVTFTPPSFAKKLTEDELRFRRPDMNSSSENYWYMELGGDADTISDAENIRDELLALAFGMWDYIKNGGTTPDAELWQLDFVGFLPGKRESRRMVGRYIMTQNDITSDRAFEDVAAFGGWPLDDHDPAGFYYDGHPNTSYSTPAPYAIPYRCLYSANIGNLFFAGRNISMTHAAMSSARVMGTCAVCGQAVGTAAAIAAEKNCSPDGVYRSYLSELQRRLLWNDCLLPHHPRRAEALTNSAALTINGKTTPELEKLRDGNDRESVFICGFGDEIEMRFNSPVKLSEVRIVFDSDLNRDTLPGDGCERKHMTRCNLLPDSPVMRLPSTLCASYEVSLVFADGTEKPLRDETDNIHRLVKIPCIENGVTAIRLVMRSAHSGGTSARLFSLEVR